MKNIMTFLLLTSFIACSHKNTNINNSDKVIAENKTYQFDDKKINSLNREKFIKYLYNDTFNNYLDLKEQNYTKEQKEKVLRKIKSQSFFKSNQIQTDSTWLNSYLSKCYLIDLNFDNRLDFIYNGASGADAVSFEIYLTKSEQFECAVSELGKIVNISKSSNSYIIIIDSYYTHGFFIEKFIKYSVDSLGFNLLEKTKNFYGTFFPEIFNSDFEFVLHDTDTIRFNPQVINKPCVPYSEVGDEYCGNIYKIVEAGSKGNVYSTINDKSWRFVRIELEKNNFILGWMKSPSCK